MYALDESWVRRAFVVTFLTCLYDHDKVQGGRDSFGVSLPKTGAARGQAGKQASKQAIMSGLPASRFTNWLID